MTTSWHSVTPAAAHMEMIMAGQLHEVAPGSSEPFAPSVSSGGKLLMDFLEGAVAVLAALPGGGRPGVFALAAPGLICGLKLKRIRKALDAAQLADQEPEGEI